MGDAGVDVTAVLTAVLTAEDYVTLLGLVRSRSGLSYRAIARRAAANGDALPVSTLATMLARRTLPRRELVIAFLRACGVAAEQHSEWLATWDRLAAGGGRSGQLPGTASGQPLRPFQLPPPPPVLVGRERVMESLLKAVAAGGAVCVLEGAGGIGKSALALAPRQHPRCHNRPRTAWRRSSHRTRIAGDPNDAKINCDFRN
jgi:hypothetical protein